MRDPESTRPAGRGIYKGNNVRGIMVATSLLLMKKLREPGRVGAFCNVRSTIRADGRYMYHCTVVVDETRFNQRSGGYV